MRDDGAARCVVVDVGGVCLWRIVGFTELQRLSGAVDQAGASAGVGGYGEDATRGANLENIALGLVGGDVGSDEGHGVGEEGGVGVDVIGVFFNCVSGFAALYGQTWLEVMNIPV